MYKIVIHPEFTAADIAAASILSQMGVVRKENIEIREATASDLEDRDVIVLDQAKQYDPKYLNFTTDRLNPAVNVQVLSYFLGIAGFDRDVNYRALVDYVFPLFEEISMYEKGATNLRIPRMLERIAISQDDLEAGFFKAFEFCNSYLGILLGSRNNLRYHLDFIAKVIDEEL